MGKKIYLGDELVVNEFRDLVIESTDIDEDENTILTNYFQNNISDIITIKDNNCIFDYKRIILTYKSNEENIVIIYPNIVYLHGFYGDNIYIIFIKISRVNLDDTTIINKTLIITFNIINDIIDINTINVEIENDDVEFYKFARCNDTLQTNLNADMLDGYHADSTGNANTIPVIDENKMLNISGIQTNPLIVSNLNSTGDWYRIFTSKSYGNNAMSRHLILHIDKYYTNNKPESYTFSINISFDNKVNITQLSGSYINGHVIIPKIRVLTKNNNISYVDIYINNSSNVQIHISGIGDGIFRVPVLSNDIPEGYTATEFNTGNGLRNSSKGLLANKLEYNYLTNENINNLKDDEYTIYHASKGNTCTNNPLTMTNNGFYLQSFRIDDTYQHILTDCFGSSYTRVFLPDINVWGSWYETIQSRDLLQGCKDNFNTWTTIPTNYKIVEGGFANDVTLALSGTIKVGENITLFMKNTATVSRTISLTNFTFRNVDTITIEANKRAEINIAQGTTSTYCRAINYED